MSERILLILTVVAAVGCAVVGGLLFAFSTAVMPALARRGDSEAAATMQSINALIQNPLFLMVFLGTALSCVGVIVTSLIVGGRGSVVALAAAAVFVIGTVGVTLVVNVPLNDRLAGMDPTAAKQFWHEYSNRWTLWNDVRTGAAVVAAIALTVNLATVR